MPKWRDFEVACTDFLNQKFGDYAVFNHVGGENSNISDIKVNTNSGHEFYMEVKYCPAQCGQFVLFPDAENCIFKYSPENETPINEYSSKIIRYFNRHFDYYKDVSTTGKNIDMINNNEVFKEWIIHTYKMKGIRFIISNEFIIIPIDKFDKYFDISANYRIKRSGSSIVGKNSVPRILSHISSSNYDIMNSREDGGRLYIESNSNLDKQRFTINCYEYMFSVRDSEYEVRKLSNTRNANIIFSIQLKPHTKGYRDKDFIKSLR
jgi:hypothetical protein